MLDGVEAHGRFSGTVAWDPSQAACARALRAHPSLELADDTAALVARDDVDVVYLACPPLAHSGHALAALSAGKPVLCEKPLGIDLAESAELVEAADRSGVAHAVNLVLACARPAAMLADALGDGRLGPLAWVDIRLHLPGWATRRYAEAPWLAERAEGGFVREVATHYVFLCQRLLGPLSLESARLDFPADGVSAERFADVRLRAGDLPITLTGGTVGAGPDINELILRGERAAYRVRELHLLDESDGERWKPAFEPPDRPELVTYLLQLDGLAAMLDGCPHPLADFATAFDTQRLVGAIITGR